MGRYEPVRPSLPQIKTPVTIASPSRSFCPHCEKQLLWYHNIPLISWFLLGGKCAFCRAGISFRYPLLEFITALAATACFLRFGLNLTGVVAFVVVCSLIVITVIDIDYMIIPNKITYPGTALGILLGVSSSLSSSIATPIRWLQLDYPFTASITDSLLGILMGGGTLYALWWFYIVVRKREGLGLGDVKLLTMLGAIFGYECAIATIFLGSIFGSIVGVTLLAMKRHTMSSYLSFGPYLAVAAVLYIFNFGNLIKHLQTPASHTVWRMLQ